jgi:hypothetical protein
MLTGIDMVPQRKRNRSESAGRYLGIRVWGECLVVLLLASSAWAANTFDSVYISEFLTEDRHATPQSNGNGEAPGWIELCNGGSEVVNLAGWFLSNTPTNLTQWRFPTAGILPGSYLVIFTSGTGRTNDLAHLHTSFRLAKDGGYLALVGPATNIVSEFGRAYPKQSPNISYGRVPGEPELCGYFQQPTPGKPNGSGGAGFAPEVVFSRLSGSFQVPFALELSCRSSNAVIRYTLDGKLPNRSSAAYRTPILLTNSSQVRARVYQEGLLPGPPHSRT